MKKILFIFFVLFAPVAVNSQNVVYDPAAYANALKNLLEESKQTEQQAAIYTETAKTSAEVAKQTDKMDELLSIEQKAMAAYKKYGQLLSLNPSDYICMMDRMAQMFKNTIPMNFKKPQLFKFNCDNNAMMLYNVINPYNLYSNVLNGVSNDEYFTKLKESKEANLAIAEKESYQMVESAKFYDNLAQLKLQDAQKLSSQLSSVQSDEVAVKMRGDITKFTAEALEYKQKSAELLSRATNVTNKYQQMEIAKQKSARMTKAAVDIANQFRYGVY